MGLVFLNNSLYVGGSSLVIVDMFDEAGVIVLDRSEPCALVKRKNQQKTITYKK
jgi:hypothetical protein